MKKIMVVWTVLAVWVMMAGMACAVCAEPTCNNDYGDKYGQAQLQGQGQGQILNNAPTTTATGGAGGAGGAGGNSYSSSTSSATSSSTSGSSANGKNILTVIGAENKRPLPNIPDVMGVGQLEYRGPYGKGVYQYVAPWREMNGWTPKMLEGFPTCAWNCKVEKAQIRQAASRNYFVVVKKSSLKYLGQIIVHANDPLEMWGKAAQLAFDMGAEEVTENVFQSVFKNKSTGWNVGLGGGASAISNSNDSVGGSFGGGTSFGSVTTGGVEKCESAFTFYTE